MEQHLPTFIRDNTTEAEWETMKKDRVYETELGDIALVAVARAIHMDILILTQIQKYQFHPSKQLMQMNTRGVIEPTSTRLSWLTMACTTSHLKP